MSTAVQIRHSVAETIAPVKINAPVRDEWKAILTPGALRFLAQLADAFECRRQELLARRVERQKQLDDGVFPAFLPATAHLRSRTWTVAPIPADLLDRRVEVIGPADRETMTRGLNSGAKVFVADFSDATAPTWANIMEGHCSVRDAARRTLRYITADGKPHRLRDRTATLMVRLRALHLDEKHVTIEGRPMSASLFDFGLCLYHTARETMHHGSGPYFCLPKLENHVEARFWNDVFLFAQDTMAIPRGTIRATVVIETITAAFEMDEILFELREHSAGLSCGTQEYICSFVRKFRNHPSFVLPNRAQITMECECLRSLADLLIETCHRRGIHATGGVAAQVPLLHNGHLNENAFEEVRTDKLREVVAGFDGTSVAHPGMVPIARHIFDQYMPQPNQIARRRERADVTAQDLLTVPKGAINEAGLRWNIDVAIRYIESWLRGHGCVSIYNLIEDTATAEICRTQVWQWAKFGAALDDGRPVTASMVSSLIESELRKLRMLLGVETFHKGMYRRAARLLESMILTPQPPDFLTLAAHDCFD